MRNILDLFAGACGGWSLGMHRAGYRTVAACEIDPWRRACFSRNFPDARMYEDVRDLTAARLRADLGTVPDVIVGSPPCQDASSANHRGKGVDGDRTGLFFEAVRLVAECRPVWCCFENVAGIRTRGIDRVLVELEALGYACRPLVVGAVHAGAPHRRNRVWLIAYAHSQGQHAGARHAAAMGRGAEYGGVAADAVCRRRKGAEPTASAAVLRRRLADPSAQTWPATDADEARLEIIGGEPGDAGEEQPAAQRNGASHGPDPDAALVLGPEIARDEPDGTAEPLRQWGAWNGGAARLGRMDDGLPRGMARAALAAYGDSVVPQITEAIGRMMMRLLPQQERAA